MAEISGFFPSINGDRRYRAADWADFFAPLVNNGVFPKPPDGLQITAGEGMQVIASAGRGWINGNRYRNTANLILPLTVADGLLSRIDRAVMRRSLIERNIRIRIKEGMLSLNPEPPPLQRDADIYELALADVRVNNGATQITQADITDHRFSTELCGIVTGAVDQIDFDILTVQFNDFLARFKDEELNNFLLWFETIKDILDEEVAGKLLLMIQALEEKTDSMGAHTATLTEWSDDDKCFVENPQIQSTGQFLLVYPDGEDAHEAMNSLLVSIEIADGGFYIARNHAAPAEIKIVYTVNKRIDENIPSDGMVLGGLGKVEYGTEVFGVPGTYMFTSKVTGMYRITVMGGGGGGATHSVAGGGGAGSGNPPIEMWIAAGTAIPVTVGAGGQPGVAGGASSFGPHLSTRGGGHGNGIHGGVAGDFGGSGGNGYGVTGGGAGGSTSTNIAGGNGGNGSDGGTGGAGHGLGRRGGRGASASLSRPASNGIAGSGGGGGAGPHAGAPGGDGLVYVEWGYAT